MDITGVGAAPKNTEKLIKELSLTPQQVQQLKAIQERFRPSKQELRQSIAAAEKELASLMLNEAGAGQIQSKRNQISSLKQQLAAVRARHHEAVRSILSSEQWQKLQTLKAQRRNR